MSAEHKLGLLRAFLVLNLAMMVAMFWYYIRNVRPRSCRKRKRVRRYNLKSKVDKAKDYITRLTEVTDVDCKNCLRMNRASFQQFCHLLRDRGGLEDSQWVCLEEKVATFLCVIGHHTKHRVAVFAFRRSGHTISRYFNEVLQCVLRLHDVLLLPPVPIPVTCDEEPWCYFHGCLGALDGTYVKVNVPVDDQAHYRNRKGFLAVNVLGVCDKDMKFTYVLTGWEGSAGDSRVLPHAMRRPGNPFRVRTGYFYLVDAGYMNAKGFLPPFRKTRYHLKDWGESTQQPANPKEYFNLQHSRARNVIERAFGLLKKRFGILRSPSYYPLETQNDIILACCLVHNFLRLVAADDLLEDEDDIEDEIHFSFGDDALASDDENDPMPIDQLSKCTLWKQFRRDLASKIYYMWRERNPLRRRRRRMI